MNEFEREFIEERRQLDEIAGFALELGAFLFSCGAHCARVKRNIVRIVDAWEVDVDMQFYFSGLILSLKSRKHSGLSVTRLKTILNHSVDFNAINDVSQLSWLIHNEKIKVGEAEEIFEHIRKTQPYPISLVLLGIGCSCAGLCAIAGGDLRDASLAFLASVLGTLARLGAVRYRFNPMISFTLAAFVTTFITSLGMIHWTDWIWGRSASPSTAMATAVLYLVPGVPLTNSVIDLIEGYFPSAISRAAFGMFVLLCIAVGMILNIVLFGIDNF